MSTKAYFQYFENYIQSMHNLISKLISNFTTNPLLETLVHYIQQQTPLYTSTDGSRTNKKSGGSWIISLSDGIAIVSGWNPDYGQITTINSYHSEINASLASLTFLKCYCNYFNFKILNPCIIKYPIQVNPSYSCQRTSRRLQNYSRSHHPRTIEHWDQYYCDKQHQTPFKHSPSFSPIRNLCTSKIYPPQLPAKNKLLRKWNQNLLTIIIQLGHSKNSKHGVEPTLLLLQVLVY